MTDGVANKDLAAWMRRAGKGDTAAFARLAHVLGPKMYRLGFRLMNGDGAAAEDAVQEALIKLWQYAPQFSAGEGSVAGYASRLVYTACMDIHRKRKPAASLDETPESFMAAPETLTESLWEGQRHQAVMAHVERLPTRQKEAVLLSYFHEASQKEMAKTLGTSEKAVESLLVRARKSLAVSMKNDMHEKGYLQ